MVSSREKSRVISAQYLPSSMASTADFGIQTVNLINNYRPQLLKIEIICLIAVPFVFRKNLCVGSLNDSSGLRICTSFCICTLRENTLLLGRLCTPVQTCNHFNFQFLRLIRDLIDRGSIISETFRYVQNFVFGYWNDFFGIL